MELKKKAAGKAKAKPKAGDLKANALVADATEAGVPPPPPKPAAVTRPAVNPDGC